MLKYLIIQLDDTSVSYCHYDNNRDERKLMPIEALKAGVRWAMKENLMVQIVYPDYDLPEDYYKEIDSIDHIDITSVKYNGDVRVLDSIMSDVSLEDETKSIFVLRIKKDELFKSFEKIIYLLNTTGSLRIVISDVEKFSDKDFDMYKTILSKFGSNVSTAIASGREIQLNLLTDRLQLNTMNNCNAGEESITLAPDGKFYICPAFYLDEESDVGNPIDGLKIPNQQLYRLEYAPICRSCDAYHCKRCVWLNHKTTLEVNTPGHEQCVVSHLERNESMRILNNIKQSGKIRTNLNIPEIDYLDPFEKIINK